MRRSLRLLAAIYLAFYAAFIGSLFVSSLAPRSDAAHIADDFLDWLTAATGALLLPELVAFSLVLLAAVTVLFYRSE
ncbi:MAG TPA: hypothetical protein VFB16_05940 [Bauldia sp.]|nr:hypothetical protein [Bauldia sp.]